MSKWFNSGCLNRGFPLGSKIWVRIGLFVGLGLVSCQAPFVKNGGINQHNLMSDKNIENPYDFCQRRGLSSFLTERSVWSAEMVQKVLTDLIDSPEIKHTPWVSYPISYRRMLEVRDQERCGKGGISGVSLGLATDKLYASQLINNHLADIMTRWYYYQTKSCSLMSLDQLPHHGFCGLMERMKRDDYDSISATMASTGVYIGPHIAISLAAVMADDAFWDKFPDPATRRTSEPLHTIPVARLKWLDFYKPHFDLFNALLAGSLNTVSSALGEAGLLKNKNLDLSVEIVRRHGIINPNLFGKIRDKSFQAAKDYIKGTLITNHPMLRTEGHRLLLNYGAFDHTSPLPKVVFDVEAFALNAVASPIARSTYLNVLGGYTWEAKSPSP